MGFGGSRKGKRFFWSCIVIDFLRYRRMQRGLLDTLERLSARFIDAQGRVFDPQGDQHTTSEGQAYAMFFALADNDRATFDRVLAWTQANLANNDLSTHLPAWLWGKDKDGQWKALDPNSASDADVWMAYTLIEAGRLVEQPGLYANLAAPCWR